jgi:hypothetical protein
LEKKLKDRDPTDVMTDRDLLRLMRRRMIKVKMNDNLAAHFEAQDTGFADFSLHCFSNYPATPNQDISQFVLVAEGYKRDVLQWLDGKSLIHLTTTHEE